MSDSAHGQELHQENALEPNREASPPDPRRSSTKLGTSTWRAAGPAPSGARRARERSRRLRSPAFIALILAIGVLISGIALAVFVAEQSDYSTSSLAPSGSFFALASSNATLYAASDNGGSVLLEQSGDRGVDWTAYPVPYSAVAGGAPWAYSAVAVDGPKVLLTAATSGSSQSLPPYGSANYTYYPPGSASPAIPVTSQGCGTNSTILIASSPDGGRSWSTTTLVDTGVDVTSLVGSLVGATAAVAWMGMATGCDAESAVVGSVTSHDAGSQWSDVVPLSTAVGATPAGNGVEMAPEYDGLLIAFAESLPGSSALQLSLWQLPANESTGGFNPVVQLPAPTSWSLQGSTTTPAYLLTPTYLIPLTQPPYIALPFDQLQQDAAEVGELPAVVSLVPTGPTTLEIAATTSDDLGVDCWQFDVVNGAIDQTCHVPLAAALFSADGPLPIVALIDGGGWWAGIGASGTGQPPVPGTFYGPPPSASGAGSSSVGTSICLGGCSSANGLLAYSYSPGAAVIQYELGSAATGLSVGGVLLLAVSAALAIRSRRLARRLGSFARGPPVGSGV
jgi:hypothetical protein